ncbi:MAG: hypothetical protein LQ349_008883, partial [Xanthoria aureola]
DEGEYNHFDHESLGIRSEEQLLFVRANEDYVLKKRTRHPKLDPNEPANASAKYLARLTETLEELRAKQA